MEQEQEKKIIPNTKKIKREKKSIEIRPTGRLLFYLPCIHTHITSCDTLKILYGKKKRPCAQKKKKF